MTPLRLRRRVVLQLCPDPLRQPAGTGRRVGADQSRLGIPRGPKRPGTCCEYWLLGGRPCASGLAGRRHSRRGSGRADLSRPGGCNASRRRGRLSVAPGLPPGFRRPLREETRQALGQQRSGAPRPRCDAVTVSNAISILDAFDHIAVHATMGSCRERNERAIQASQGTEEVGLRQARNALGRGEEEVRGSGPCPRRKGAGLRPSSRRGAKDEALTGAEGGSGGSIRGDRRRLAVAGRPSCLNCSSTAGLTSDTSGNWAPSDQPGIRRVEGGWVCDDDSLADFAVWGKTKRGDRSRPARSRVPPRTRELAKP